MNAIANRMTMVLVLAGMAAVARGGLTNAPAAPSDAGSAMFTLNDLYNKVNTRSNVTLRTGAFVEPTSGPTGTMHTLNDIMKVVTNRVPVAKTGATNYYSGDDGYWATNGIGVLGLTGTVRFTTAPLSVGQATTAIVDNVTGLMWARDVQGAWGGSGKTNWTAAINACNNMNSMNYGGYNSGWRLPNVNEMFSLITFGPATSQYFLLSVGHPFIDIAAASFWTSTTPNWDPTIAVYMGPSTSGYGTATKTLNNYYVWPVRGGGN